MADVLAAVSGRTNENNDETTGAALPENAWGEFATDHGGTTPSYQGMDIFTACQSGNLGVVILLWYKGVSVMHRDPHGVTPLHQAAYNGYSRICKFLLSQGAEIDAENSTQSTPIMWATCGGHYETVRYLASQGASLTKTDNKGSSVPFHAIHTNQVALLHWLHTEHGKEVDFHATDTEGHNLFQWAAYKGFLGGCRYLNEVHKVKMDTIDKEGRSSLHWVAREGYQDIAEYMLSQDPLESSFNHRDNSGLTPTQAADSKFHPLMAKYLRKHAPGQKRPTFGHGKERSTVSLMMNNIAHLRRFVYGLIVAPLFFMYLSNYIPGLAIAMFVPFLLVVPAVFDSHLFRGGQPPVRMEGAGGPAAPSMQQQILLLSVGGERNLNAMAVLFILQFLIPFRFFYYNTPMYHAADVLKLNTPSTSSAPGDFILSYAPMLYSFAFHSWVAAMMLFVIVSTKRAQKPQLPATDIETGDLRISVTPGSYCFELMERKSLRSVYSRLTGTVVAGFDHFSIPLDNDIGKGNRGLFIFWLIATMCWAVAVAAGTYIWAAHKVSPDAKITVCRLIGNIVSSSLPGGDPTKTSIFFPTQNEVTGAWCGSVCVLLALVAAEKLFGQIQNIGTNINNHELTFGNTSM